MIVMQTVEYGLMDIFRLFYR